MARVQTIVQLSADLLAALDEEAERSGISRSAVIRHAVAGHLASSKKTRDDQSLVDGYRAIPQNATDEWGSVLDGTRESTRRTLKRLVTEEDAAGLRW